jgi:transcriptional regulator of acetoin/glycerol metabolism
MVLDESTLETAREQTDWLTIGLGAVRQRDGSFGGYGHVLSVFDADGRMLSSEGDPHALEGLAEINFAPGGLWTEQAAGTNGPGTALATGAPAHIVGAEHFCQAWHRWHCAAVPVRHPLTGGVIGVLDISGFREYAHPHSLNLAHALVLAIEQMLGAREVERRYLTLRTFTDLAARYPGDGMLAVDRASRVLLESPGASALLPFRYPEEQRAMFAELLTASSGPAPREVSLDFDALAGRRATWYPVLDGRTVVGGCLLLERRADRGIRALKPAATRYSFRDVIGESPRLLGAVRLARAAADTALPVLLLGESGTGKEVFAQAIHEAGARRDRPFVAVNCAALPRELIESELFGYEGGAFSGARREGGTGKFEAADGGTIFLDEIGELSPTAQAALLRVLQEGEITRVGSPRGRRVDVRVIAATNQRIEDAVASGRLRQDVYHRLNVLSIELPALRDRVEDLRLLAGMFVAEASRELSRPGAAVSEAVLERFERYQWPGNVRELKNLVRRLIATAVTFPVTLADLPPVLGRSTESSSASADHPGQEQELLMEVVASARTMAEAAARLGITRSTLYRRMERFGLRPERVLRRN